MHTSDLVSATGGDDLRLDAGCELGLGGRGADALVVGRVAAGGSLDAGVDEGAGTAGNGRGVAGALSRSGGDDGSDDGGVLHLDGLW